jgi:hypothetical protein
MEFWELINYFIRHLPKRSRYYGRFSYKRGSRKSQEKNNFLSDERIFGTRA